MLIGSYQYKFWKFLRFSGFNKSMNLTFKRIRVSVNYLFSYRFQAIQYLFFLFVKNSPYTCRR